MTTEQIAIVGMVASVFNSVGILLVVVFVGRTLAAVRKSEGHHLAVQIEMVDAAVKSLRAQLVAMPRIERELRLMQEAFGRFRDEQFEKGRVRSEIEDALLRGIRELEHRVSMIERTADELSKDMAREGSA